MVAVVLMAAGGATALVRDGGEHATVTTTTSASVNAYAEYVKAVKAAWAQVTATTEAHSGREGWSVMATALRSFAGVLERLTPPGELMFKHTELMAEARSTADLAEARDRELRTDPNAKDSGQGFQALARHRALGVRIAAL